MPILWSWMLAQGVIINFAHRTFVWQSAAKGKAAVHCVIIGFSFTEKSVKTIYDYDGGKGDPVAFEAKNINPYLVDTSPVFVKKRRNPLDLKTLPIAFGSMPNDGGGFIIESHDEMLRIISEDGSLKKIIRPFLGSYEFINNKKRYCFWLVDCSPQDISKSFCLRNRVAIVRKARSESTRPTTRALANTPALFGENRQPKNNYLAIPEVSSENRLYLPIGFLDQSVIASNKLYTISDATLYDFGVIASIMHNAWMRTVTGRLKSDYQYSSGIVYNNFPWPLDPTDKQKTAIEAAAQAVLDARAQYPESSLADLYDPLTMPADLLKAHQKLDKAVDAAYGKTKFASEAERVAFLFELYQHYIKQEAQQHAASKTQKSRKTS